MIDNWTRHLNQPGHESGPQVEYSSVTPRGSSLSSSARRATGLRDPARSASSTPSQTEGSASLDTRTTGVPRARTVVLSSAVGSSVASSSSAIEPISYETRRLELHTQSSGTANEGEPTSSPVGWSACSSGGITDEEFAEQMESWIKSLQQGALPEEEYQKIAKYIARGAEYLRVQTRMQREHIERTAAEYEELGRAN